MVQVIGAFEIQVQHGCNSSQDTATGAIPAGDILNKTQGKITLRLIVDGPNEEKQQQ